MIITILTEVSLWEYRTRYGTVIACQHIRTSASGYSRVKFLKVLHFLSLIKCAGGPEGIHGSNPL